MPATDLLQLDGSRDASSGLHCGAARQASARTDPARASDGPGLRGELARDVDRQVCQAVAAHLVNCGTLPPPLARELADELVDAGKAEIADDTLMALRPALSMAVVHALMSTTSERLLNRLVERHQLPRDFAARLIFLGQERAIAETISSATDRTMLRYVVGRLKMLRALTPTLLLRLVFQGDLRFFEEALETLTGASRRELRQMFEDADWKRFQELYREAGLPGSLFPAFRIAIDCDRETGGSAPTPRSGFAPAVLDRLAGVYPDVCPADIEHVLTQLARQPGAMTLLQSSAAAGV